MTPAHRHAAAIGTMGPIGTIGAIACLAAASALAGCAGPPGIAANAKNHAPVARIVVPQLWPASEPATIDGSLSDDVDGDTLAFAIDWGDGTPSAQDDDGIAHHTYASPGTFTVQLTATDPDLAASHVEAQMVLVGDDDASCTCSNSCFDDAVCTQRGCLLFRSSSASDTAPDSAFADALDCP